MFNGDGRFLEWTSCLMESKPMIFSVRTYRIFTDLCPRTLEEVPETLETPVNCLDDKDTTTADLRPFQLDR